MNTETKQRHLGRKIWYGLGIAFCVLVIIISVVGVPGIWVVGNRLSAVTGQTLVVVENTADGLSTIVVQIDQEVAGLEETSTAISEATSQLGQNVTDKGLILTLLPEEREQQLIAQVEVLQQDLNTVSEALKAGLELYQSIDNLPFVSLPKPEPQTVASLEQTIVDIQSTVQEVVQATQDFRVGVSEEISKVTGLLDDITTALTETRQNLAQLRDNLAALQSLAAALRSKIPFVFTSLSIIVNLFLAWLIYTQVEIIRLYVQRWKGLGGATAVTNLLAEGSTDSDLPVAFDTEGQEVEVPNPHQ